MNRRAMTAGLALSGLASFGHARAQDAGVSYTRFDQRMAPLTPWRGRHVAILTADSDLDPAVMDRLLACIDLAYEFYASLGALPQPDRVYQGRLTIAEVEETCGAGCGYLGYTGIELQTHTFARLYSGMRDHGWVDQAVIYELGRNFWLYGPQLDKVETFVTGFAILNRFLAIRAARVRGGPFDDLDYAVFEEDILDGLWRSYTASDLTWRNTLAIGAAPPGRWGGSDFAAAVLNRIVVESGLYGYRAFWRALQARPAATDQVSAIRNLVQAAAVGARLDLSPIFRDPAIQLI